MNDKYLSLSDKVYDEITLQIRKTYPNVCVVWIEKIFNAKLEEKYEKYKSSINPPNEKRLYHGTSERIARIICEDGFDPSYNTASSYGKGVYFSTRAFYSSSYSLKNRQTNQDIVYLLVCDVVLGKTCKGLQNTHIDKGYDSATDNLKKPDMYIVNKREACIPRYLVAFYPDAK